MRAEERQGPNPSTAEERWGKAVPFSREVEVGETNVGPRIEQRIKKKKKKNRSKPVPYLSGLHPESRTFLATLPAKAMEMSYQSVGREGALVEAARWDAGRDEDDDDGDDSGAGDAAAASVDRL